MFFSSKKDKTFITSDFQKMKITMVLVCVIAVISSVSTFFLADITASQKLIVILVSVTEALFVIIYWLSPKFSSKRGALLLMNLIFVLGIDILIFTLGMDSRIYYMFFFYITAVAAFLLPRRDYIVVSSASIISFLSTTIFFGIREGWKAGNTEMLAESLAFIALVVVFRIIASEISNVREELTGIIDISEKVRADRERILKYINIMDNGFILVDEDKNITYANEAAGKILFQNHEQNPIGKNIENIMKIKTKDEERSVLKRVFETGKSESSDDVKLLVGDVGIDIFLNVVPLSGNKDFRGAMIFFRDISEMKRLAKIKEEFNALISHELRAPLAILEGYLDLLVSKKDCQYDEKSSHYIKIAHQGAMDLMRLADDVLTVASSGENNIVLDIKPVDIVDLTREALASFRKEATQKGLKLIFEQHHQRSLPVVTDPEKVKEILNNLLENAIKFTEKGSVKISIEKEKDFVKFSIKDTGIGIKEVDQEDIFKKFFRSSEKHAIKAGGTGLGLYVSRVLVERMGGKIYLESQYKMGSTFYFTIPLYNKA